jgi:hypothetical protein
MMAIGAADFVCFWDFWLVIDFMGFALLTSCTGFVRRLMVFLFALMPTPFVEVLLFL